MTAGIDTGVTSAMDERGSVQRRGRLRRVAARRWWVVLLCAALGAGLAFVVAGRVASQYQAEAVVVVPAVGPAQAPPGSPDAAAKLAQTYAQLIPLDDEVLQLAANKAGTSAVDLAPRVTVTNPSGTALLTIDVVAASAQAAVVEATAIATAITGPKPAGQIASGSLRVVQLPTSVKQLTETSDATIAIGALLGLLLGIAIAAALERSDRRVDDLYDLAALTGSSVSRWDQGASLEARALVHRWKMLAGRDDPVVGFVGSASFGAAKVARVAEQLAERASDTGQRVRWVPTDVSLDAGGRRPAEPESVVRLVSAGRPGHGEGAELAAQTVDIVVLLAQRGGKARDVGEALDALEQFGVRPSWALLTKAAGVGMIRTRQ